MEILREYLKIENSHSYVFMMDKQKGLIDVVDQLFPNAEHRHCLKHLYANFNKDHKGLTLKLQMESIARATTLPWFYDEMKRMLNLHEPSHTWPSKRNPSQWARSHFRAEFKCDILLNDLSEAFNRSILNARDKPVLTMLERVKMYIMLLMASRREFIEKCHDQLGPRVTKVSEENRRKGQWCISKHAGQNKFQVQQEHRRVFVVNLNAHTCGCRSWDISGIPCQYACSAVNRFHGNPADYVDDYSKK